MPLAALASLAGKGIDAWISGKNADKNIKMQKQFAQHGISWKVDDAKAAGLHPLAALGAQTSSFSPVSVGSDFGSSGQDIGRAMQATQNEADKVDAHTKKLQALGLQRAELENTLLASQISKYNQAGQPPPMPAATETQRIDGQRQSGLVKIEPQKLTAVDPRHPGQEPGAVADVGWSKNPDGSYTLIPSKAFKDRTEDMTLYEIQHLIRNQVVPDSRLMPHKPPYGKKWANNPLTGRWWLTEGRRALPQHARSPYRR